LELKHEFSVAVPLEQAWEVLTDLERIAPCMPGAQLQEVEGDEYRGIVKVKVGPITAQYKGVARFSELDGTAHRAVLRAEGRDTRGQGRAAATVIATLAGQGDVTAVQIETDLDISGKVAQFGRGMLAEVSEKLLGQFVAQLEADVLSGPADGHPVSEGAPEDATAGGAPTGATEVAAGAGEGGTEETESGGWRRRIDAPPAEPVDVLAAAGGSLLRRVGPVLLGLVVVLGGLLFGRSRRRGGAHRSVEGRVADDR
jgi:carbon monoxide dehydrogenase subunit G